MFTLVFRVKVAIHVAFASSGFWGDFLSCLGTLGAASGRGFLSFLGTLGLLLLRSLAAFFLGILSFSVILLEKNSSNVISFYVMIAHIRMVRAMRSVRVDGSVGVFGRTPGASR